MPAGLLTTIKAASSNTTSSGMACARASSTCGRGTDTVSTSPSDTRALLSVTTCPPCETAPSAIKRIRRERDRHIARQGLIKAGGRVRTDHHIDCINQAVIHVR